MVTVCFGIISWSPKTGSFTTVVFGNFTSPWHPKSGNHYFSEGGVKGSVSCSWHLLWGKNPTDRYLVLSGSIYFLENLFALLLCLPGIGPLTEKAALPQQPINPPAEAAPHQHMAITAANSAEGRKCKTALLAEGCRPPGSCLCRSQPVEPGQSRAHQTLRADCSRVTSKKCWNVKILWKIRLPWCLQWHPTE